MSEELNWTKEIEHLKNVISKTGLIETKKWGIPVFTHKSKNVVGLVGFKKHFALWFYNGVFLSDPLKVLIIASEGKTKALRQWRFHSIDEINENALIAYIQEAVLIEESGMSWKPEKIGKLEIPEILKEEFARNSDLHSKFNGFSSSKQNEFIEHLESAKREETKLSRLEKIIPLILEGKGLNDKYRKC